MTRPGIEPRSPRPFVGHSTHLPLIKAPLKFLFSYVVKLHHLWYDATRDWTQVTKTIVRTLYPLTINRSTSKIPLFICCEATPSLVWHDQGLNPGHPDHCRTLYPLTLNRCTSKIPLFICCEATPSLVWRDLGLNPGHQDHCRTLYPLTINRSTSKIPLFICCEATNIFGMTRPGIEPRSPRPLSNTLPTYH